ncbi:MAG: hypothetical protein FGM58_06195 [Acidimicrobiia bacterium]|nr:hypothetical protein [Acidimicrobiia bacterium]
MAKAEQFWSAALLLDEHADDSSHVDAFISLSVLAGIAASDVVCCRRLGVHSTGRSHSDAVKLIRRADHRLEQPLRVLLGLKTASGYGSRVSATSDRLRARRAALALLDAARRSGGGGEAGRQTAVDQ